MKIYWLDFVLAILAILLLAYGLSIDNWRYIAFALIFGLISFLFVAKKI